MTNDESNLKSQSGNAPSFPIGLCLASIATTSLALVAAALGVKWGAAPSSDNALRLAWLYLQPMLAFVWFVVWPAARPSGRGKRLLTEWAALGLGAVPAITVAATLSAPVASTFWLFIVGQVACGFAALMVLALALRHRAVAIILPIIALVGPVLAFLWSEFLRPR